jgi:glutathione S-transferase
VIVLRVKNLAFEVTYIDLQEKPDWFLEISPHGKVPVLKVDDEILFESNAIAEFLEEQSEPRLHPADPIKRARNRAWTDFISDFSKSLSGIYYTKTRAEMEAGLAAAPARVQRLEDAIANERGNDGPFFNGDQLSLVDAAYAPFLQRFDIVERVLQTGLFKDFPLVRAWSEALLADERVTGSVVPSFEDKFNASLKRREFYVASLFDSDNVAAQ